jgi:hypothetical protein
MVTMELGAADLQLKKLYFVQSQRVFRLRVKDQLPQSMAQCYVLASWRTTPCWRLWAELLLAQGNGDIGMNTTSIIRK